MVEDFTRATGVVQFLMNGKEVCKENMVVTLGKQWIAKRMANQGTVATHIGIGSSATAAALGDTALGAQLARVAMSVAGGTVSGATVTYSATFGAGVGTGTVQEAGLFDAATAGTLIARTAGNVITKLANDVLTINWSITIN